VGDAQALRMALASIRETMSSSMPLKDCLILLRARLPCLRIMRAIYYILLVILRIRLGEFMLRRLILFLTMLLFITMRLSHPVLEGKPNANYVRARIRTHVHSDYINEHHHTMLEY
jgi:hypothetical protein